MTSYFCITIDKYYPEETSWKHDTSEEDKNEAFHDRLSHLKHPNKRKSRKPGHLKLKLHKVTNWAWNNWSLRK